MRAYAWQGKCTCVQSGICNHYMCTNLISMVRRERTCTLGVCVGVGSGPYVLDMHRVCLYYVLFRQRCLSIGKDLICDNTLHSPLTKVKTFVKESTQMQTINL